MKRVIVGAPGLFEAGFMPAGEAWATIVGRSRVFGLAEPEGMAELSWLGLPEFTSIAQGPLIAAAFQIWPPERSVVFEASFLGLDENDQIMAVEPTAEEAEYFFGLLQDIARRGWTFARGEGDTHVLVHERGSIDISCPTPAEVIGTSWEPVWPQGDEEDALRSLTLDSRERFEGAAFNRRRVDEGQARIAFIWPWGPGLVQTLPNLGVTRGELVRYESSSHRMKGAARLAGYWHGDVRSSFAARLQAAAKSPEPVIAIEPIRDEEAAERFGVEVEQFLFDPLVLRKSAADLRLTILDPSQGGLGLNFDTRRMEANGLPFDRRVLDDPRLRTFPLHESILRALSY